MCFFVIKFAASPSNAILQNILYATIVESQSPYHLACHKALFIFLPISWHPASAGHQKNNHHLDEVNFYEMDRLYLSEFSVPSPVVPLPIWELFNSECELTRKICHKLL